MEIETEEFLDVYNSVAKDDQGRIRFHSIELLYTAVPKGKNVKEIDAQKARWIPTEKIEDYPLTEEVRLGLARAQNKHASALTRGDINGFG